MIYSETIEIVYSNIENSVIFSEEVHDYRVLDQELRLTEPGEARNLEDENKRLLE